MTTTKLAHVAQKFGDEFQGYPLFLNALDDRQLLIVVRSAPAFRVRLSTESEFSKKVDQLGISDEVKLGDPQLDDSYVIRAGEPDQIGAQLTPEARSLIARLGPFVELDLTAREYRLLKEIPDSEESVLTSTLDTLVDLVKLTS